MSNYDTKYGRKVLEYLLENDGATARQAASYLMADSPSQTRSYNQGNGATSGKGAWLSMGSYLAKLVGAGLVLKRANKFYITKLGLDLLTNNQSHEHI